LKKILIIDDEELIRRSLNRIFTKEGFQVFEAQDGKQGLSVWLDHGPDIVLLDYMMPFLTGLEVLARIPEKRRGQVIVISAYVGDHEKDTFLKLGVKGFYKKPFEDIFKFVEFVKNHE
jgi:DNA-binding response OmpR family regulator